MVIVGVWITSAIYSIPKFIFVRTISNDLGDGKTETICIVNRTMYNSKWYDLINFALLYVAPLLVMLVSVYRECKSFETAALRQVTMNGFF